MKNCRLLSSCSLEIILELSVDRLRFSSKNKVALAHSVDGMSPDFDPTLAPSNMKIGVVIFDFRNISEFIREIHRFNEIGELKHPFEVTLGGHTPRMGELIEVGLNLVTGDCRSLGCAWGTGAVFEVIIYPSFFPSHY